MCLWVFSFREKRHGGNRRFGGRCGSSGRLDKPCFLLRNDQGNRDDTSLENGKHELSQWTKNRASSQVVRLSSQMDRIGGAFQFKFEAPVHAAHRRIWVLFEYKYDAGFFVHRIEENGSRDGPFRATTKLWNCRFLHS